MLTALLPLLRPGEAAPPSEISQLGAWPLSETSGVVFADAVGANDATLTVPSWTIATHTHNRPGIVAGGASAALEISNGGPAVPLIVGYKQTAMSLVLYVEPWGTWRGSQYWNTSSEKFGREYLAFRDDNPENLTGGTPGAFAIYRRHSAYQGTSWYLGGYVRDAAGTKQYFGGSYVGVVAASMPAMSRVSPGTTARRVVLTMGPAGAELWLDNTRVAHLSSVTTGWAQLAGSIKLGCGDATRHANERSPFWGRMAQAEVWRGQINPTTGAGQRPAVSQSQPYKEPSGPKFNVASYPSLQACMDAAHAGNGWVYQAYTDTNWYTVPKSTSLGHRDNCRGMIGVRVRRAADENENYRNLWSIGRVSSRGGMLTSSHGNPYAADGGYRVIGCMFDGNARNQDWSLWGGATYQDHDLQQSKCVEITGDDKQLTVTIDCCEFMDSTSDGVSTAGRCDVNTKSSRFWGTFRGAVVVNNFQYVKNIHTWACEMDPSAALIGATFEAGSSLCDVEPFGTTPTDRVNWKMWDCWAHNDWDDRNRGNGHSHYYNTHVCGPGFALVGGSEPDGCQDYRLYACTVGYWRKGLNGYGVPPDPGTTPSQYPHEAIKGGWPGPLGAGFLFEDCVFLAANRNYYTDRTPGPFKPQAVDPSPACHIRYELEDGQTSGRKATFRRCQWRPVDIGFVPQANRRCLVSISTLNTGYSFELDDVKIDAAFADQPFVFGGATVRHRNVLHERTGNTKPWSGAGAEVAI